MKNTKTLIILCLILFLTAIGCSDYMEFAERESQAEREYRATEDAMEENYKEEGFLIYNGEVFDKKRNYENEQGYSPMEEKEYSEMIEQDLEKSTKESEIPEERRDSYWKRLRKFRSE
jgi:major membrane immunogen (membrane-anchored lipoprotein)